MTPLAVTVLGVDRPGIVAAVTGVLDQLGGNLEDSASSILRGQFAMTLIVSAPVDAEQVRARLAPVAEALDLTLAVRPVPPVTAHPGTGSSFVLSVHGADRPGIVAAVAGLLADRRGNITSLSTRVAGELYVLVAEVELPAGVAMADLTAALDRLAAELGVRASLHAADADLI